MAVKSGGVGGSSTFDISSMTDLLNESKNVQAAKKDIDKIKKNVVDFNTSVGGLKMAMSDPTFKNAATVITNVKTVLDSLQSTVQGGLTFNIDVKQLEQAGKALKAFFVSLSAIDEKNIATVLGAAKALHKLNTAIGSGGNMQEVANVISSNTEKIMQMFLIYIEKEVFLLEKQ